MNGPWSETVRAWTAVPAAWGQQGGAAAVAAWATAAVVKLVVPAAVPTPLTHPVCASGAVVAQPGAAEAVSTATPESWPAVLGANLLPGLGLAEELGLAGVPGVSLGGHPAQVTMMAVGLTRAAGLAVTPGTCLAGTGLREVVRLSSPPTTAVRLFSLVCLKHILRSSIDIEQT